MKGLISHTLTKHLKTLCILLEPDEDEGATQQERQEGEGKMKKEVRRKLGSAARGEEQEEGGDLLDRCCLV